MPPATSARHLPPLLSLLLLLLLLQLAPPAAVAGTAEQSNLETAHEDQEFPSRQGAPQQEFALEEELQGLKSYAATTLPPVAESNIRSAYQEQHNGSTLVAHNDVSIGQSSESDFNTADVRKTGKPAKAGGVDQVKQPPLNLQMGNSSLASSLETHEIHTNSVRADDHVKSEAVNGKAWSSGAETIADQQECLGRNDGCRSQPPQHDNAGDDTAISVGDIQKRALLPPLHDEDMSAPASELSQISTDERGSDTSYEGSNDGREVQEPTSEEEGDNYEDSEEETGASEEAEDGAEEEEDVDDYLSEGSGKDVDGELEVPDRGTPDENGAEQLADTTEFNKVAEDLLELMVHIAENPSRWQRLALNLKEDASQTDGYRSLTKRRSLERLKHRNQQREFDWSKLKEYKDSTGRHVSDAKERKNRLRQLMKAGVLPEEDHILRPLGKNRSGKGGNALRNRNKGKLRQRGRGRGRPSRRKLARKGGSGHEKHNGTVSDGTSSRPTDAPSDVEATATTRKAVHPMHDPEFLQYARQVASRYQTALTDDVIREKVMQGWKGTPAPEKETPPYSGKKLPQYDPEAVISRYKYILTDEAIREKIMQGPRGHSDDTRERHRPPLPPPRNISVPPYREPFLSAEGEWPGRKNSSHHRPEQQQERVAAEPVMAGRNDSGTYNVSTRGGAQYGDKGRYQLKHGRYSARNEMWRNFVDRALNSTHADRGWEKEQGVQPKQAAVAGGGGGVEDNNLPAGPAPQPTPRRLPHFTYHRVTSQPAPRSRHRDAYVAVSVAAPPDGHRQRHKGAEQGAERAAAAVATDAATAGTPTAVVSPPATTPASIDLEAIRRVLHMRDPLEEELVEAAVAARQLARWPASGGGGDGGGGDGWRRRGLWQHLGDVLKLQEETKTLAALEAKLHSAREADQDRVREILRGDVSADDGALRGM